MRQTLFIILCVIATGCGANNLLTVAPQPVQSHHASFDENNPNSGIVASDPEGFIVTQHFLDRHHINNYTRSGMYFRITGQQMAEAIAQDEAKRQ